MRVLQFLAGLFLMACSGLVFVADFLAHSAASMRWIIENRAVGYVLWSIPEAACCVVCGIVGLLLLLWAVDPAFCRRLARDSSRHMSWCHTFSPNQAIQLTPSRTAFTFYHD